MEIWIKPLISLWQKWGLGVISFCRSDRANPLDEKG